MTTLSLDERIEKWSALSNSPKRGSDYDDPLRPLDFHSWPFDIETFIDDLIKENYKLKQRLKEHDIYCVKGIGALK